ncbi:hypothetical protein COZ73_00305 [Candidatus Falkowbacteria bacterium CG_4_8_14_3_um_filter_36_11]|nr:MAG: hypothetical protein COZ73_00305 [Candidatus Falkowbacteria bacterium CG_4_8_14_3_um_filter_36_11]
MVITFFQSCSTCFKHVYISVDVHSKDKDILENIVFLLGDEIKPEIVGLLPKKIICPLCSEELGINIIGGSFQGFTSENNSL